MKDRTWIKVKNSANICLSKMNPSLAKFSDPVGEIYNNNLPGALKEIAVFSFIHGNDRFGPELLDVRNGLEQLNDEGFIASESKEPTESTGEWLSVRNGIDGIVNNETV